MVLVFPRSDAVWVEVGPISIAGAHRRRRPNLSKPDHPVGKPDTLIFLKLQIVRRINQAETMQTSQGMTRWSF
jgi:hypothetical protein